MNDPTHSVILVALEDSATASIVATAAAHLAMEQGASTLLLLHVLDTYLVAGGLLEMSGVMVPVAETGDEQEAMLALAEAAIQAEYRALGHRLPSIARRVSAGPPAGIIAQVAAEVGATAIVVGAQRPHAFGRLAHPDVRAALAKCTKVPVYVVPLQANRHE